MIRENKTKAKLKQGEVAFGVIGPNEDATLVEMFGLAGFDFYMVDAEHGGVSPSQAAQVARACELTGITPLARLGQWDPKLILQYLDSGILGIMQPGLRSAAEVAALAAAIKYAPLGKRGLGQNRANDYFTGSMSAVDYVTFANEQTLVLPQFEEADLLSELPTMVKVAGVDGFVIGPRDLALDMGFADGPNHPEVQAVIDQAIKIIKDAGLAVGITAGTAEQARQQIARGATFILNSVPNLIRNASQGFLAARK